MKPPLVQTVSIAFMIFFVFSANTWDLMALQYSNQLISSKCKFSDNQSQDEIRSCFEPITVRGEETFEHNVPILSNQSVTTDQIPSSVNIHKLDPSKIWVSKVVFPVINQASFDNVGEPSFASNGSLVFYAGNHYAGSSVVGNKWRFVDPNFDFRGIEGFNQTNTGNTSVIVGKTVSIFKADQHIEYDPYRHMYIWVRQGDRVSYSGADFANIDRLAVSTNTTKWTVFDLITTTTDILDHAGIFNALFDYPDTAITRKYLYLTTTVYDTSAFKKYGLIFRVPLDDLRYSIDRPPASFGFNYNAVLDEDIESISPVKGSSDPMYFGAQIPNNSNTMKIYEWDENSLILHTSTVSIEPWNAINSNAACSSNSEAWWCKANTNSRIRSAWMSDNSLNFMWNAATSYNNGKSWIPYVDSATIYLGKNMHSDRKYHLADPNSAWQFATVAPDKKGVLGALSFYYNVRGVASHIHPYFTLAIGQFNKMSNKWEMVAVANSTASMPVQDENGNNDYNIGDFLTIKPHIGIDKVYNWDASGYVITGKNYNETEPYFIMAKG